MEIRCVIYLTEFINSYFLLIHIFLIHWMLELHVCTAQQCGVFWVTNPPLSNGVLHFKNNEKVNISFSLNNTTCGIKSPTYININRYNPEKRVLEPQCTILQNAINHCRKPSVSDTITCGCLDFEWNYFFTTTIRGNTIMKVSVDGANLQIPELTISLTTDPYEPTAIHIIDTKYVLTVGISAGVVVFAFIAGLIHCWKSGSTRNITQVHDPGDEINIHPKVIYTQCESVQCVNGKTKKAVETRNVARRSCDDSSAKSKMQIKARDKKCREAENVKPEECLDFDYLNPVPHPEDQNESTQNHHVICKEVPQTFGDRRLNYNHLNDLKLLNKKCNQ